MDFNYEASIYLTKISTAGFIVDMGISAAGSKVCREGFIRANKTAIRHLEKSSFKDIVLTN